MLKKLSIIICFLMFFIVSCSGGGQNAGDSAGASGGDKQIVLGFAQVGAESEYRTANTKSIREAASNANIELVFSDAQQKQENQIKAIRSFIARKVDVIAFSPVVESGFEAVLQEAKQANIPVIVTDRRAAVSSDDLYVAFIGSDFIEEGKKAANWLVEYMNKLGRGSEQLNIVELQGTVGSSPANDRQKGFSEVISNYPNYKIIRSQTGDFTRAKGKEVMEAFLKAEPKIDILFAHNDDMAIGAIQAIEEAGKKPGQDIVIVSIDGVRGAFEAMMAGKLNCTVECNPLFGDLLMETVKKVVAGEEVPKSLYVEESIFPAEVAAQEFPNRQY